MASGPADLRIARRIAGLRNPAGRVEGLATTRRLVRAPEPHDQPSLTRSLPVGGSVRVVDRPPATARAELPATHTAAPVAVQRAAVSGSGSATPAPSSALAIAPDVSNEGVAAAAASTTMSSTAQTNQLDRLIEAIEERVLLELERRGGRFAREF